MSVATPRVLVVSESRITRRVVEMTFADQPLQLAVFTEGSAARDDWQARPPAVLIADIAAKAPDGYELARELRAHDAGGQAVVLLLAGQSDVVDEAAVAAARVSAVLRKPLDSHQLIDAVREALRTGPPPAVAAPGADPGADPVALAAEPAAVAPDAATEPPAAPAGHEGGLAETFHALLDVEQGVRPSLAPPALSDEEVDRIAVRAASILADDPARQARLEAVVTEGLEPVLGAAAAAAAEQATPAALGEAVERVVREMAPALVEQVARAMVGEMSERLVREEIARLRSGRPAA